MKTKTIISCALTGAKATKEQNASLPVTPEEIAEDAYRAWKAGAAIVHLHVRDENAEPIMDVDRFRQIIKLIREHKDCDVIINCTSSGYKSSHQKRMQHFIEIPEIEVGSFDAGTFNWGCTTVFQNDPEFLKDLALCYLSYNVKPEVEIFDLGMIGNLKYYIKEGLLQTPVWCQFILNVLGGCDGTVDNLVHLVRHLPDGCIWSCSGIGATHLPMLYTTLALGGHIRVGLEDNLYYLYGEKATNEMLVARAARIVREFGNEVATPAEARQIIGIKER